MSTALRLSLFAVVLAAVFVASLLVGSTWGPTLEPVDDHPSADHRGMS